jgi:hypothetical protein
LRSYQTREAKLDVWRLPNASGTSCLACSRRSSGTASVDGVDANFEPDARIREDVDQVEQNPEEKSLGVCVYGMTIFTIRPVSSLT